MGLCLCRTLRLRLRYGRTQGCRALSITRLVVHYQRQFGVSNTPAGMRCRRSHLGIGRNALGRLIWLGRSPVWRGLHPCTNVLHLLWNRLLSLLHSDGCYHQCSRFRDSMLCRGTGRIRNASSSFAPKYGQRLERSLSSRVWFLEDVTNMGDFV